MLCLITILTTLLSLNVVDARSLGAYNIKITKDTVTCTGRCTCSLQTTYSYQTRSFINYCPNCHSYGTIRYEVNKCRQNKEGMWYCTRCDMDRVLSRKIHSYSPPIIYFHPQNIVWCMGRATTIEESF